MLYRDVFCKYPGLLNSCTEFNWLIKTPTNPLIYLGASVSVYFLDNNYISICSRFDEMDFAGKTMAAADMLQHVGVHLISHLYTKCKKPFLILLQKTRHGSAHCHLSE